jgi:hypothetical protein
LNLVLEATALLALPVQRVLPAQQVLLVNQSLVLLELPAQQALQELPVLLVHKVLQVHRDQQVRLALPVLHQM